MHWLYGVPTKHSCLLQPERPAAVRARAVKSELSDVEGLGFKLEERQKDILELKRTLKLKVSRMIPSSDWIHSAVGPE